MMQKLEERMGAEALQRGLREYLSRFSYGNATWDDLIDILGKVQYIGTEVPDPSVPMSRLEYHYREVDIYEQSSRNRPGNNKQLCGSA